MADIIGIMRLYTAYFNRAADRDGIDYWAREMNNNGWTLSNVASSFAEQLEYQSQYSGLNQIQIVERVYQNVLNRDGEQGGIDYWSGQLSNGNISVSQLVQAVVNAAIEKDSNGNYKNNTDASVFNNKTAISQYCYDNNVNATGNKAISLISITSESSSLDSLKNDININPIANAGSDKTINEGDNVTLNASSSYDTDGQIVSYEWSENGIVLSNDMSFITSDLDIGKHSIVLEVFDNEGASDTDEVIITVNDVLSELELKVQEFTGSYDLVSYSLYMNGVNYNFNNSQLGNSSFTLNADGSYTQIFELYFNGTFSSTTATGYISDVKGDEVTFMAFSNNYSGATTGTIERFGDYIVSSSDIYLDGQIVQGTSYYVEIA